MSVTTASGRGARRPGRSVASGDRSRFTALPRGDDAATTADRAGGGVVAILVDDATWPWRGRLWAHLASDESLEELHAFGERLGLRRAWFQGDHYDVPAEVREHAVRLGAQPVASRELVRRLRAAGLRRPGARRNHPG